LHAAGLAGNGDQNIKHGPAWGFFCIISNAPQSIQMNAERQAGRSNFDSWGQRQLNGTKKLFLHY
jgi:hypothetical protein